MTSIPPIGRLRQAQESDIPAIISIFLTSFRLHPLFSYLHSPLQENLSFAADTVFFWRRRLQLFILDPSIDLRVVVVPPEILHTEGLKERSHTDEDDETQREIRKSWEMLRWANGEGGLRGDNMSTSDLVVGFATWTVRKGSQDSNPENIPARGWSGALRTMAIEWELKFWRAVYKRKDQDAARIAAYAASEDELEEKYYQHTCYYLDQLVVDFRLQGFGFGNQLVRWGISRARELQLPAMTEASPMSERLYAKLGFKKIGMWTQPGSNGVAGLEEPVMRLDL